MIDIEYITSVVHDRVSIQRPLAKMTTFKLGGPADIVIEPNDDKELLAIVTYLNSKNSEFIILGNGSNILISDEGYHGVAVVLGSGLRTVEMLSDGIIAAGAGMKLAKFVDFCIANGRKGAEMLAGIPGTLGGAIIMNAGAYGGEISDHLVDVTVIRNGELTVIRNQDCGFAYRTSALRSDVVVSARFEFPQGVVDEMVDVRRELLLKRNSSQPVNHPNAGSIFKNPEGLYAAKLIEEAGLKGERIGSARVSELHANFIVSEPDGSAQDVVSVINMVRKRVFNTHGIILELEIKLIGFPNNVIAPLAV